ncbi:hypothetical protein [Gordonia aurantiaca]|uniref:hypothetical protein n=1 Tax=Gordonia sp. B21 TaxID=3151852 RepID=UPI003265DFAF
MKPSKYALPVIAALSLALTLFGAGSATAAWSVEPGRFPHTQALTDGKLTVTVTNTTDIPAGCALSVYRAADASAVANMTRVMNEFYAGQATSADLLAARALIAQGQYTDLTMNSMMAGGTSHQFTWNSRRTDTSYTVLQNCTANDEAGTVIWGVSSYVVSGSGARGSGGTGSLGSLFG